MRHILLLSLLASWSLTVVRPLVAQRSLAMHLECKAVEANTPQARQRADGWVQEHLKAFLPPPGQSLRLSSLALTALQTELALKGIMSTCEQYRQGRIDGELADITLAGYEQTIKDFTHDLANEAQALAAGGQVSQIDAIRRNLMATAGIARQSALLGLDRLAEEAGGVMVRTLVTFSTSFLETCWNQSFDDDLPYGIQRQNELLGTGIDVTPCAKRRFTARVTNFTFESCTVRGVGDWRVRWHMAAPGSTGGEGSGELKPDRDRARGHYAVDWGANGVEYRAKGKMELERHEKTAEQKASYTLSGDMDIRLTKGKELISMFEKLIKRETKPAKGPFEVEAQVSDKPCKSLEE